MKKNGIRDLKQQIKALENKIISNKSAVTQHLAETKRGLSSPTALFCALLSGFALSFVLVHKKLSMSKRIALAIPKKIAALNPSSILQSFKSTPPLKSLQKQFSLADLIPLLSIAATYLPLLLRKKK